MAETRWLVDAMLGRLARYLRFMGEDTEYLRDADDDLLAARAVAEGRVLVTRDRELAGRTPGAVLLTSVVLRDQLRSLRRVHPEVEQPVRFVRCSLCNAALVPATPDDLRSTTKQVPRSAEVARPVYRCTTCGQLYWEGSHTERIRRTLRDIFAEDG